MRFIVVRICKGLLFGYIDPTVILEWCFIIILSVFSMFQVKIAYINFLNHCYVDTEVEMKEIYTSNHMWKLFENFLVDICRVSNIRLL